MSTFNELRRRTHAQAKNLCDTTGVDMSVAMNVLQYTKQLTAPGQPERIDELVFVAQLGTRFGITSRLSIHLIFESLKVKAMKYVRLEDYARMICVFYTHDLSVKVDFVYNVYDFNRRGAINHSDMYKLLETSVNVTNDDDPTMHVKELIDIVISLVDQNSDGIISLEEFRDYVKGDILCLELFGQVLPQEREIERFRHLLTNKTPKKVADYFRNERAISLSEPKITHRKEESLYSVVLDLP